MNSSSPASPSILAAARQYWADRAQQSGPLPATRELFMAVWEFVRDSMPSRLRQRFGDADYDWEHRVNTTSGALDWRDRLLGAFHSAYQPTEPAIFHEMLDALRSRTNIYFEDFTFIDLGSGKGRTLLMASDYPFRRIVGVELLPSLNQIATQNLRQYSSESQKCFTLESACADATSFHFPKGPLLVYLFNPFLEAALQRTLANLEKTLRADPRHAYLLYHNPQLEPLVTAAGWKKLGGTHQYSIFASNNRRETVKT
jgi:SAM-dependent methyltransferase